MLYRYFVVAAAAVVVAPHTVVVAAVVVDVVAPHTVVVAPRAVVVAVRVAPHHAVVVAAAVLVAPHHAVVDAAAAALHTPGTHLVVVSVTYAVVSKGSPVLSPAPAVPNVQGVRYPQYNARYLGYRVSWGRP